MSRAAVRIRGGAGDEPRAEAVGQAESKEPEGGEHQGEGSEGACEMADAGAEGEMLSEKPEGDKGNCIEERGDRGNPVRDAGGHGDIVASGFELRALSCESRAAGSENRCSIRNAFQGRRWN
jgi:hypothetical protein